MNKRKRVQSANTDKLRKAVNALKKCHWIHKLVAEIRKFIKCHQENHLIKMDYNDLRILCKDLEETCWVLGQGEFVAAIDLLKSISKYLCNCCVLNWEWLADVWDLYEEILSAEIMMIQKIQGYHDCEEHDKNNIYARQDKFTVAYNPFFDSDFKNQKEFLKEVLDYLELGLDFFDVYDNF